MPPKNTSDHPLLPSNTITPSQSHRGHFSISNIFDAAAARRSGGGYHFGGTPTLSQLMSSSPRLGHGLASGGSTTASHWSSTAQHPPSSGQETVAAPTASSSSSSTTGDVSSTLQEVRRRIIEELRDSQEGSREAAAKLHAHRQRALQVAFGEGGASAPGQRAARMPTARAGSSGGLSPGTARASPVDDDDEGVMVASVEFSLLCPYSRLPIRHPVRSRDCNHLQCCDLDSWVVMLDKCRSMRDPVGPCPVCERRVIASSLEVDLWMRNVLEQMPGGTHMVVLEPDGSFRSGDTTREKRKEQMMEVVDATQGDYENYLGDVVDDDNDGDVVLQTAAPSATLAAAISAAGSRRPRSPSPGLVAEAGRSGLGGSASPMVRVKQEKAAQLAAAAEESNSPPVSASQDDGGVVVVHFVESQHDGLQALPSQIRLWVPHCTNCGAPRVKAEDGSVAGCQQCGQNEREKWNLVRRFEASPAVSMELMPDGTLVLHGTDLIAPYLYRAGFHRSLFEVMEYAAVAERERQQYRPPAAVWASSFPLSRFEIDFLEACCARIAEGSTLDDIEGLIVPNLFRIPRRRRPGGPSPYTQQSQRSTPGGGAHNAGGVALAPAEFA